MFQSGLNVTQIAAERGLVSSTIERHLTYFVQAGTLEIGKLLPSEKQQAITQKLTEMKDSSLKELKIALGDDYTYDEIKLVLACLK